MYSRGRHNMLVHLTVQGKGLGTSKTFLNQASVKVNMSFSELIVQHLTSLDRSEGNYHRGKLPSLLIIYLSFTLEHKY